MRRTFKTACALGVLTCSLACEDAAQQPLGVAAETCTDTVDAPLITQPVANRSCTEPANEASLSIVQIHSISIQGRVGDIELSGLIPLTLRGPFALLGYAVNEVNCGSVDLYRSEWAFRRSDGLIFPSHGATALSFVTQSGDEHFLCPTQAGPLFLGESPEFLAAQRVMGPGRGAASAYITAGLPDLSVVPVLPEEAELTSLRVYYHRTTDAGPPSVAVAPPTVVACGLEKFHGLGETTETSTSPCVRRDMDAYEYLELDLEQEPAFRESLSISLKALPPPEGR